MGPEAQTRTGISSVLVDSSLPSSLLPSFPSLSSNPYVPASFSSLGTAFSSSALPKPAPNTTGNSGGSGKVVAQRRSRAPPVQVSELRKVARPEFDNYLAEVGTELERWERERRIGRDGHADLGGGQKTDQGPQAGLGIDSDGLDGTAAPSATTNRSGGGRQEEQLPPLEVVPSIFFDTEFTLANPRTFDIVTERILASTPSPPLPSLSLSPSLPSSTPSTPGLGPLTLADLATDQILQEKLSHYTAVIESHLVLEIGLRSSSFFAALSNLQSLHHQGEACLAKIAQLQHALEPESRGVGAAAKKGLAVLRGQARRRALEKIERGVREVEEVSAALEGVKELVEHGEWMGALEVAEQVEALYYGHDHDHPLPPPPPPPSSSTSSTDHHLLTDSPTSPSSKPLPSSSSHHTLDLTRVKALSSVPLKLSLLRSQIAKSLDLELVSVLDHEMERSVDEYIRLARASTSSPTEAWTEGGDESVKEKYLPSTDNVTAEDEEAFAQSAAGGGRSSVDLGSVSEKSASLAKKLRALPPSAFLTLASQTYLGLLGTLSIIDIHASVLLSLASSIRASESLRKSPRPPPPTSSSLSLLSVPGSSSPPRPPSPALSTTSDSSPDTYSTTTLASDVADVLHAAAELANLRFSKVIAVRSDVHAQLSLEDFVAIFDASWDFVVQRKEERLSRGGEEKKGNGEEEGATTTATAKQLDIEGREYFAVSAGLACVDGLVDYLMVVMNCPLLTTDAMSKVVEYMKSFNSRTCQVVLGAGAMRSAGLKNITAKHLALASQALSIMISLIPYIRETLRRHLNPKQAVMLVEFDKLKRDYQEHQNEIHAKLVAIMSDRMQVHSKSLEAVDWEAAVAGRKDGTPNAYMEALVKEHMTLHKVLSRFLQGPTVEFIMAQVFSALNARLADEFAKVQPRTEAAKHRMLADVAYLKQKLAELKGLERETPGTELEFLIESKITPEATRAGHTRRESLANVPAAVLPTSPTIASSPSFSSPPSASSTPPPPPPPPAEPSPPSPTPTVTPTAPAGPVRRKSMAERLAEISRRGSRGSLPPPLPVQAEKGELPTVPQEPESDEVLLVVPNGNGNQAPLMDDVPPSTPEKEFPPSPTFIDTPVMAVDAPPPPPPSEPVDKPTVPGPSEAPKELLVDILPSEPSVEPEDPLANGVEVPTITIDDAAATPLPSNAEDDVVLPPPGEEATEPTVGLPSPAKTNGHAPVDVVEVKEPVVEAEPAVPVEEEIEEEESSFL
ncbi:hypothetical protein RQP46_004626 [Phenoliferia psychrophenolica]